MTLDECLIYSLHGFFSGLDSVERPVEVIFGVLVIVILLNVVIAIVSDSWQAASLKTKQKYWSFRLAFITEMRMFAIIEKNFLRGGILEKFTEYIDQLEDITITDNAVWSKSPYSTVETKHQYENPYDYFEPALAEKIKDAHSLHADLHWVKQHWKNMYEKTGPSIMLESITATLQWIGRAIFYCLLLVLGSITGGYFWPVRFRRGTLYIGIRSSK